MAFHWQTFRTRALSAIVFLVVMAVGLLWNERSFFVLFFIIHIGCWREFYRLVKKIHPVDERAGREIAIYLMIIGSMVVIRIAFGKLGPSQIGLSSSNSEYVAFAFDLFTLIILTLCVLLLIGRSIYFRKLITKQFLISAIAGLFYISLSLAFLIQLRTAGYLSPHWAFALPLLIIFTNWVNDTMAYIVGSLIGKTPFSPISPKKTWEGTIGGVVLAVVVMSGIAYLTGLLPVGHTAALSAICAISGTYGDLAESKLKRMAGVKDSGSMMPGHGGFLDRFDSLLFSATAGALYVWLVMV